jgi:signal transduction histidine kinase
MGVSAATSMEDVTGALLPHVAPIFGGDAALLAGPDGAALGAVGMDAEEAARIGRELAAGPGARLGPGVMALPLRSGWLVVRGTEFTPFFGRDELDLLASIASFVDLAIERADLFASERAARAELERSNAELEAFLYSVSHDLKSPLVSLSGYLGYVQQDFADAMGPQGREYLDRMAANAAYMQDLIQDLLELSRVGRILTEPSEIDLAAVIDDIAAQIRDAHPDVGIELGDVPAVLMNPVRARQLFTNLLDNAVTHGGRPDLHIRVEARQTADGVEISVADDGAGIPEGYREKVFGVFERLESRRGKGTGIGLAICRKIVDHLGGRIWITGSEQGTDIRIQIPSTVVRGWIARVAI